MKKHEIATSIFSQKVAQHTILPNIGKTSTLLVYFVTFASIQNDTQDIMTERMDGMYVLTRKMPTRLVMWTEALKHGKSPVNVSTKIYLLTRKVPTRLVM